MLPKKLVSPQCPFTTYSNVNKSSGRTHFTCNLWCTLHHRVLRPHKPEIPNGRRGESKSKPLCHARAAGLRGAYVGCVVEGHGRVDCADVEARKERHESKFAQEGG